jgi:hypothetical protein
MTSKALACVCAPVLFVGFTGNGSAGKTASALLLMRLRWSGDGGGLPGWGFFNI